MLCPDIHCTELGAEADQAQTNLLLNHISQFGGEISQEEFTLAELLQGMRSSSIAAIRELANLPPQNFRAILRELESENKIMFVEDEEDASSTIHLL